MPRASKSAEATVDEAVAILYDIQCNHPVLGVDIEVREVPHRTSMFEPPGGYTEATFRVRYRTTADADRLSLERAKEDVLGDLEALYMVGELRPGRIAELFEEISRIDAKLGRS